VPCGLLPRELRCRLCDQTCWQHRHPAVAGRGSHWLRPCPTTSCPDRLRLQAWCRRDFGASASSSRPRASICQLQHQGAFLLQPSGRLLMLVAGHCAGRRRQHLRWWILPAALGNTLEFNLEAQTLLEGVPAQQRLGKLEPLAAQPWPAAELPGGAATYRSKPPAACRLAAARPHSLGTTLVLQTSCRPPDSGPGLTRTAGSTAGLWGEPPTSGAACYVSVFMRSAAGGAKPPDRPQPARGLHSSRCRPGVSASRRDPDRAGVWSRPL